MLNKFWAYGPLAIAAVFIVAFSSAQDLQQRVSPQWLFVHAATTARLVGASTVVMPIEAGVFAFTDRPLRQHMVLGAEDFITLWGPVGGVDNFTVDPPNAVLTWHDGHGKMHLAEGMLTAAHVDVVENTIQYVWREEFVQEPKDEELHSFMNGAALYIDLPDPGVNFNPG